MFFFFPSLGLSTLACIPGNLFAPSVPPALSPVSIPTWNLASSAYFRSISEDRGRLGKLGIVRKCLWEPCAGAILKKDMRIKSMNFQEQLTTDRVSWSPVSAYAAVRFVLRHVSWASVKYIFSPTDRHLCSGIVSSTLKRPIKFIQDCLNMWQRWHCWSNF